MRIEKGKWYVCINSWSDDGWTKFYEGSLLLCEENDVLMDCCGFPHIFYDPKEVKKLFREATETERNIANIIDINIDDFVEDINYFDMTDTLIGIYKRGAKDMLWHIRSNLSIKG